MRHSVNVFSVLVLICALFCPPAIADSLEWIYSYEDALKLATREGKPIMAGFYTTWCGYCRTLDMVTYVDSMVVAASKGFVCLKVDAEKRRDVAYGYGVGKLPTILFLEPSGRVIWREFGYRGPVFLAGRMREVLTFFKNSRAAEPYIKSAYDEAGRGRMDQAISILNNAVAMYPNDARLYAARGSLYMYKKDLDAALGDLNRSLSLNQADDSVLTMRGMVYYEKKDPGKAMYDYTRAISINRWGYEAYNGRGIIYLEQNDPDMAIKNFNTTLLINPRHAGAYFYRGLAHLSRAEFDKAISDLGKAIELQPDLLDAYSNRAFACMHAGQYDKSWEDVHFIERRGVSMKPEFMAELRRLSGGEK